MCRVLKIARQPYYRRLASVAAITSEQLRLLAGTEAYVRAVTEGAFQVLTSS